jgi:hypothetical protein
MEEKKLAYRIYCFVPYNISDKQKGIQALHGVQKYDYKFKDNSLTWDFIENHMTCIILDGGTTNKRYETIDEKYQPVGTLDRIYQDLCAAEIPISHFEEPDLNDALTAVCFLADERVWDYKNYPDFFDFIVEVKMTVDSAEQMPAQNYIMLKRKTIEELKTMFPEWYPEWVEFLGGEKNLFLRELIRGKKLA